MRVGGLGGGNLALQEFGERNEGLDDVDLGPVELEVLQGGIGLVQVWRVDEVPVGLEGVALTLDVVGEGSALTEGVLVLLNKVGVVDLEGLQLVESGVEDIWGLSLKDSLGSSSDCSKN